MAPRDHHLVDAANDHHRSLLPRGVDGYVQSDDLAKYNVLQLPGTAAAHDPRNSNASLSYPDFAAPAPGSINSSENGLQTSSYYYPAGAALTYHRV